MRNLAVITLSVAYLCAAPADAFSSILPSTPLRAAFVATHKASTPSIVPRLRMAANSPEHDAQNRQQASSVQDESQRARVVSEQRKEQDNRALQLLLSRRNALGIATVSTLAAAVAPMSAIADGATGVKPLAAATEGQFNCDPCFVSEDLFLQRLQQFQSCCSSSASFHPWHSVADMCMCKK